MSVNADFSTLLKCLASGKKSIEQLRPSTPRRTSALELLEVYCFRILLVYPCTLYYGMLILSGALGACPTPPVITWSLTVWINWMVTAPKRTLIQIPQVVVLESAPRGNISLLKTQVIKFSEVFKDHTPPLKKQRNKWKCHYPCSVPSLNSMILMGMNMGNGISPSFFAFQESHL